MARAEPALECSNPMRARMEVWSEAGGAVGSDTRASAVNSGRRRIIFTGMPEGVICGYPKENQVWLKAGDRLTSTIEKLGELQFSLA